MLLLANLNQAKIYKKSLKKSLEISIIFSFQRIPLKIPIDRAFLKLIKPDNNSAPIFF